jgi:stage V sporulation protein D (sporulation-specific penicillin-binding protein)
MAAPTVGAVLEDILPYLEVKRSYEAGSPAAALVSMPDLSGMTRKEAEKLLKDNALTALTVGEGETVTGQLPSAGTGIPGGSQVIVYWGEEMPEERVTVPNFAGMTVAQAAQAASEAGLCILASGNPDLTRPLQVLNQYPYPDTEVAPGTIIELKFTDRTASD